MTDLRLKPTAGSGDRGAGCGPLPLNGPRPLGSPNVRSGDARRIRLHKGVDLVDLDPGAADRVSHASSLVHGWLGGMVGPPADGARGLDNARIESGDVLGARQIELIDGDPDFPGFAGDGGNRGRQGRGAEGEGQRGARDR